MLVRNTSEVEAVDATDDGANGVKIRVMLGKPEGAPNFVLRHFRIEPGGNSPLHTHPWEHEVYVLGGSGVVVASGDETPLSEGDTVLVPPDEEHQFRAADDEGLEFLCIIPHTD